MKNIPLITVIAIIIFSSNISFSQITEPEKELDDVEAEIKKDESQFEIDKKELAQFKEKFKSFTIAFEEQNRDLTNALKNELLLEMKRELIQSELKIEQDKEEYKQSKKEYKLAKKRTKISKEDYQMSENDEADKKAYQSDIEAENQDKDKLKDNKKDYKAQKDRLDEQEKIFNELDEFVFIFSPEYKRENKKHKELIVEFIESMEEDLEAAKENLDD
jgi:hypothetical protein